MITAKIWEYNGTPRPNAPFPIEILDEESGISLLCSEGDAETLIKKLTFLLGQLDD